VIGKLAVRDVDTGLVLKVLEPLWTDKSETASRVRGRIESILDWAKVRGYRDGENPARWRGHLDHLLPRKSKLRSVQHFPAVPYAEIPAFMESLRQQKSIAARALEFAILTAARSGEIRGATGEEINNNDKVWVIPASRMKAGREHRVPLSGRAMAIVKKTAALGDDNGFLFPGPHGQLAFVAMITTVKELGYSATVHGFRSTFRDWAAECTAFPSDVVEMALAHAIGSKVEAAYRRGDLFNKRRQLMDAWAKYCERGQVSADVVPLRRS
jgi:integrase